MVNIRVHPCQAVLVAVSVGCVLATASSAAVAPAGLLRGVLTAALRQRSVHYVSAANFGGARVSEVGDAGLDEGTQVITVREGDQSGRVTITVASSGAYIRGDAFALVNYMGLNPTSAARYAGVWIRVRPADPAYARAAAGVTLASLIGTLDLDPPLSDLGAAKVDGEQVVAVRGSAPTTAAAPFIGILYGNASSLLPVEEVGRIGAQVGHVTLSRWGEPVDVATPRHATPISAVAAG